MHLTIKIMTYLFKWTKRIGESRNCKGVIKFLFIIHTMITIESLVNGIFVNVLLVVRFLNPLGYVPLSYVRDRKLKI